MRLLLVDDDEDVHLLLCSRLRRLQLGADLQVISAHSGAAALERVDEGRFDLILSDVHMPGRTGPELITALQAAGCTTPVVLIGAQMEGPLPAGAVARVDKARLLDDPGLILDYLPARTPRPARAGASGK